MPFRMPLLGRVRGSTFATDNGDTGTEERIRDGGNHA